MKNASLKDTKAHIHSDEKKMNTDKPSKKRKASEALDPSLSHGRQDNTVSTKKQFRKLDSLARLLQGPSQFVSVAIVENQLLVSANELYIGSKENEKVRFIKEIFYFLQKMPAIEKEQNKSSKKAFKKEILLKTCGEYLEKQDKGLRKITRTTLERAVEAMLAEPVLSKSTMVSGKIAAAINEDQALTDGQDKILHACELVRKHCKAIRKIFKEIKRDTSLRTVFNEGKFTILREA